MQSNKLPQKLTIVNFCKYQISYLLRRVNLQIVSTNQVQHFLLEKVQRKEKCLFENGIIGALKFLVL